MKPTAHYFKGAFNGVVIISDSVHPVGITIKVANKEEARKVAAKYNAVAWNF